ncbi:MAG: AbiH family protein [Bacilli bacterium]
MDKKDLIQKLSNVKLIIGNGFDLSCNLHTKYSDYFLHDNSKNEILKQWKINFATKVGTYANFTNKIANRSDFWVDFEHSEEANFWDIFFFIISYEETEIENWTWYDIEKIMESWLHNKYDRGYSNNDSFDAVYEIINANISMSYVDDDLLYLAAFCYKFNGEKEFKDKKEFYNFLLCELKKFEANFGKYIYSQQYNDCYSSFGIINETVSFFNASEKLIKSLCNVNNLVSIDSFNYGDVHKDFMPKLHHINGDIASPIFGTDSNAFSSLDDRYIFSKTNRRMQLDFCSQNISERLKCDNLVIFGSSLSNSDYSYFFSVFDDMRILDENKNCRIVFAYNIYDSKRKSEIEETILRNVAILFQEYSSYKGLSEQMNRVLDYLIVQGKVMFFQID